MVFPKYIAWLNGTSVAVGTLTHVRTKAIEIFQSPNWQAFEAHKGTILRVSTYGAQKFVSSEVLAEPLEQHDSNLLA